MMREAFNSKFTGQIILHLTNLGKHPYCPTEEGVMLAGCSRRYRAGLVQWRSKAFRA